MKCEELQEILYEDPRAAGLEDHLARCEPCRALQQDLLAMSGAFAEQDRPALPSSFELSLRRRLTEEVSSSHDTAPAAGEVSSQGRGSGWQLFAAAAAIILMIGGALLWHGGADRGETLMVQHHKLQLAVQATSHHPEARFQLELPPGVRAHQELEPLLGQGRTLRWVSVLKPGLNQILLPLIAEGAGTTRVRARLTVDGKTLTTEVELKSAPVEIAWVIEQPDIDPFTSRSRP